MPSNLSDLRTAHSAALPVCALWNCTGFPLAWHVAQVNKGSRLIPSIQFPFRSDPQPDVVKWRTSNIHDLFDIKSTYMPFCLRSNNWGEPFCKLPEYRLPLTLENASRSPLRWTEVGGVINDDKATDTFGPAALWGDEGRKWSQTPFAKMLADELPDPPFVLLTDNGEAFVDSLHNRYMHPQGYDPNGVPKYEFFDETRRRSYGINTSNLISRRLAADPQYDPWDCTNEWAKALADQRWQFAAEFARGTDWTLLTESYKGGYPGAPQHPKTIDVVTQFWPSLGYDALSGNAYPQQRQYGSTAIDLRDFTSPGHLHPAVVGDSQAFAKQRETNPRKFVSVFTSMHEAGILYGHEHGLHEPMTPERFCGYVQWLAWTAQQPGSMLLIQHWSGSARKPGDKMLSPVMQAKYPTLAGLTEEDYALAAIRAVDEICENETVRRFWMEGEKLSLPSTTTAIRSIGDQRLIFSWNPSKSEFVYLIPPWQSGDVITLDFAGQPYGYWLHTPARAARTERIG